VGRGQVWLLCGCTDETEAASNAAELYDHARQKWRTCRAPRDRCVVIVNRIERRQTRWLGCRAAVLMGRRA
jgi:hypothetical protein